MRDGVCSGDLLGAAGERYCNLINTFKLESVQSSANSLSLCLSPSVCLCLSLCTLSADWVSDVNSRILYELDHKKPILYVLPIENILGRLPVVPVGDTGTIPHGMRHAFPGAYADSSRGAGDGCPLWYVNSWALGWSREI